MITRRALFTGTAAALAVVALPKPLVARPACLTTLLAHARANPVPGGFLVPEEFAREMLAALRQETTMWRVGLDRIGGVTATRRTP